MSHDHLTVHLPDGPSFHGD